jgi:hypothetical protein
MPLGQTVSEVLRQQGAACEVAALNSAGHKRVLEWMSGSRKAKRFLDPAISI